MPTFTYRAYGSSGEFAEGAIDAGSEATATDMLWEQGLTPFELTASGGDTLPWWRRDLFAKSTSFRTDDLVAFTREFATLTSAELPLDDSLRILSDQAPSAKLRSLAEELLADILDGAALSDAMQKRPKLFPVDYVSVVRASEIGGVRADTFTELANLLERRAEISAEIRSALIYPALLIGLSLVSVGVVFGGLIPSIAPVFAENGRRMPTGLSIIISLEAHWQAVALGSVFMAVVLGVSATIILKQPSSRLAYQRLSLRLPLYGPFALRRETARFARTLGTLLGVGVPLLQAATSARAVVANGYIGTGLDRAIDAIREGSSLYAALRGETAFPSVALRIISVGEEAGKLDRVLIRLAEMFDRQTQHNINRLMSVLTPALTVAIAMVIGGLILSVISAILDINDIAFR